MKWYAKSKTYCRGRLFIGPPNHRWLVLALIAYIIYSLVLWFMKFSYFDDHTWDMIVYFLYPLISLLCLVFYLLCSFTDPGVLHRHKNYEELKYRYDERKAQQR